MLVDAIKDNQGKRAERKGEDLKFYEVLGAVSRRGKAVRSRGAR